MNNKFIVATLVILFLGIVSVSAVNLTVTSPSNGEKYNSRAILVSLSADEISGFFYLSSTGRWIKLCQNTDSCNKVVRFAEEGNTVSFKAVAQNAQADTEEITFSIDTKKPKISKIIPKSGSFVNASSEFFVEYSEENLEKVTLFYGLGDPEEEEGDCEPSEKDKKQNCSIGVINLEDYDGQEISYWFEIEDTAGNKETSRKTRVKVDTTPPVNTSFNYSQDERNPRKIKFVFEIEEINFDKIIYKDQNDQYPSEFKTLCSSLRYGRCVVSKTFQPGTHILDIIALDKAGNSVNITNSTGLPITIN